VLANDGTFGSAVAVGDLDGDGVAELIVGAQTSSYVRPQTGVVQAWRGGPMGGGFSGDPWLVAVGDPSAQTRFGAAVATMPGVGTTGAWLTVGAPGADEQGPETGAAFRWLIPR
jgi:hypothetical protein